MTESKQDIEERGAATTAADGDTPEKVNIAARIYGVLMMLMGILDMVVFLFIGALLGLALYFSTMSPELAAMLNAMLAEALGDQTTLAVALVALSAVLALVGAVLSIRVGYALLRSRRRKVATRVRALIVISVLALIDTVLLSGVSTSLIPNAVELAILVALSVRIDPTLATERKDARIAEQVENEQAAAAGMEGRDLTGKGYLRLNFFNLFWEFVVCCVLGLILEIVWHMTVVDPGVYEDRAGLLYGPFSPIYGFGAVLVTLALNRLYNKNPAIIFGVSAVVGGAFEAFVSLFMQLGFGATAWDYSDYTIFGVPDPVAVLAGGRTSTMFLVIWGILGLVWVKAFLPMLLRVVNLIPWKLRYWVTTACALLMLVNGTMTLMSLDCWFERVSGAVPQTPAGQFFATYYDDDWMAARFESMTIEPKDSTRLDNALREATAIEVTDESEQDTPLADSSLADAEVTSAETTTAGAATDTSGA